MDPKKKMLITWVYKSEAVKGEITVILKEKANESIYIPLLKYTFSILLLLLLIFSYI